MTPDPREQGLNEGSRDVLDELVEQHLRIAGLISRVRTSKGNERMIAFAELRALLAAHEVAEEAVVRPAVAEVFEGNEPMQRQAEAERSRHLLEEADRLDPDDVEFLVKFAALERAVNEHAELEEMTEWGVLESHCDSFKREEMGQRVRAAVAVIDEGSGLQSIDLVTSRARAAIDADAS